MYEELCNSNQIVEFHSLQYAFPYYQKGNYMTSLQILQTWTLPYPSSK